MPPRLGTGLLFLLGCTALVLAWQQTNAQPNAAKEPGPTAGNAVGASTPAKGNVAANTSEPIDAHAIATTQPQNSATAVDPNQAHDIAALGATEQGLGASPWRWPGATNGKRATAAQPKVEPSVPVTLAFRALWYLGTDPAAETTWARAINDRTLDPGVRSDLIADMVDEGYLDNNHPTKDDLAVIVARLRILERHAPLAWDEVNRTAFAQAYRGLLEHYTRLTAAARPR